MIDEIYNCRQSSLLTVPVSAEWETLTDEQLTMFHRLCDLQSATAADDARTVYKTSFKDGVTMMIEVQISES